MSAKMATPSLSYDPATLRLMYDGTIATNAALIRPAPVLRTSCTPRHLLSETAMLYTACNEVHGLEQSRCTSPVPGRVRKLLPDILHVC